MSERISGNQSSGRESEDADSEPCLDNFNSKGQVWTLSDTKCLVVLTVLACLVFLPLLGTSGILNSSDGYYTEGAREMLETGRLMVPILNYEHFFEKPILIYWMIAACYKVFGVNTFASRLPSALSAISLVAITYWFARGFVRRRAALLSSVGLLALPLFVAIGHIALTDMPLTFFISASIMLLVKALEERRDHLLILAYASMGCGFLCKGPIGVVFPVVVVGCYLLATRRSSPKLREAIEALHPLRGALILLAVTVPWFLAVHFLTAGDFTYEFFVNQNIRRASGELSSHNQPFWFFIPFIVGGFFPFSFLAPLVPALYRRILSRATVHLRSRKLLLLSLVWLAAMLAMLFSSTSKLATYLLPLSCGVTMLGGPLLDRLIRLKKRRFLVWTGPIFVLAASIAIPVTVKLFRGPDALEVLAIVTVSLLVASMVGYAVLLYQSKLRLAVVTLVAVTIFGAGTLTPLSLMERYDRNGAAMHDLLSTASRQFATVAVVADHSPWSAFYVGRPISLVNSAEDASLFMSGRGNGHAVLVERPNLSSAMTWFNGRLRVIDKEDDWLLLSAVDGKAL